MNARSLKGIFCQHTKTVSLKEVHASLQTYVNYWESRIANGDLLLEQWMYDAYEAAKEALAAVDRIGVAIGIDLTQEESA